MHLYLVLILLHARGYIGFFFSFHDHHYYYYSTVCSCVSLSPFSLLSLRIHFQIGYLTLSSPRLWRLCSCADAAGETDSLSLSLSLSFAADSLCDFPRFQTSSRSFRPMISVSCRRHRRLGPVGLKFACCCCCRRQFFPLIDQEKQQSLSFSLLLLPLSR